MKTLSLEEANQIAKQMMGPDAEVWYGTPYFGRRGYLVGFPKRFKFLFWTIPSPSTIYISTGSPTLECALEDAKIQLRGYEKETERAASRLLMQRQDAEFLRKQFLTQKDTSYLKMADYIKTGTNPFIETT